jgi:hypothetical protein
MKLLHVLCSALALIGCDLPQDSDEIQRQAQERLSKQATQEVGMPAIVNFQEKRMLKMILELRDTKISTITYIVDLNGKLHRLCTSIGYGFPYATQYTNPMRYEPQSTTLPQADPNGLFSPSGADGTWVLCSDPKSKKINPVYVEPRIIVSPYALD